MSIKAQLKGREFGDLKVIQYHRNDNWGSVIWKCQCKCGTISYVRTCSLVGNHITQCRFCASKKHGMSETKIYSVWQGMKTRCTNQNAINYKDYGGRGIFYDPAWEIFVNFHNDMGNAYKKGLTLERKNNNLGYSKDNCIWITPKQQNKNMRTNVRIQYKGKYLMPEELSKLINLLPTTIYNRKRKGWSDERIISTPTIARCINKRYSSQAQEF